VLLPAHPFQGARFVRAGRRAVRNGLHALLASRLRPLHACGLRLSI